MIIIVAQLLCVRHCSLFWGYSVIEIALIECVFCWRYTDNIQGTLYKSKAC